MRPPGEIRQALLAAAHVLDTPERGPTFAELCHHAQVSLDAGSHTVKNMVRSGALVVKQSRRVDYRNRPVHEYAPGVPPVDAPEANDLGIAVRAWAPQVA